MGLALLSILLLGVRQSKVSISGLNFLWAGFFLLESLKFEGLEVIFIPSSMVVINCNLPSNFMNDLKGLGVLMGLAVGNFWNLAGESFCKS